MAPGVTRVLRVIEDDDLINCGDPVKVAFRRDITRLRYCDFFS